MRHLVIYTDACGCLFQVSSHGYFTIMRQHTCHCFFVIVWPITTPFSRELVPYGFFLFPKLKKPLKGWRFATKKQFAGRAQDYIKKCLSEVLRGLEKALAQVYYI